MEQEQLLADLDRELRAVLGALQNFAPVTEDVTLADETGTVRVTVRPDASLAEVVVASAWSEEIEPEALPGVIGETLGRAQARAMGFDIDALEAGQQPQAEVDPAQVEAARGRLLADAEAQLLTHHTEEELNRRMDELPGIADGAIARLDKEIERLQRSTEADLPQDPSEFTPGDDFGDIVESENRMVSVRLVAGLVAEVRIREGWLERRSGNVLTQCFKEIIEQLPEAAATQTQQGDSQ